MIKPIIIGTLRAAATDLPRLTSLSEINPDNNKPTQADKKGMEARKPVLINPSPRY
jgi:hypothetical protein